MKIPSIAIVATLAAIAALPGFVPVEAAAQDRETVTPAFQEAIPNSPGRSLIGIVVSYPPSSRRRRIPTPLPPSSSATCSQARSEAR